MNAAMNTRLEIAGLVDADAPGREVDRQAVIAELCWPVTYGCTAGRVRIITANFIATVERDLFSPGRFTVLALPRDGRGCGYEFLADRGDLADVGLQLRRNPELRNLN